MERIGQAEAFGKIPQGPSCPLAVVDACLHVGKPGIGVTRPPTRSARFEFGNGRLDDRALPAAVLPVEQPQRVDGHGMREVTVRTLVGESLGNAERTSDEVMLHTPVGRRFHRSTRSSDMRTMLSCSQTRLPSVALPSGMASSQECARSSKTRSLASGESCQSGLPVCAQAPESRAVRAETSHTKCLALIGYSY